MKVRTLPDWFAPVFGWVTTIVVLGAAIAQPEGVYVNRSMLWFPPLLAVAWTAGFVAMQRFKKKYKEEHEGLGSPQLFGSPYEGRSWRFLAYLFGFRFLRLGDQVVSIGFSVFVGLTIVGLIGVLSLFGRA
jgi:hypothetical protein